jgi:flagellar hook-length control protein FliK
LQGEPVRSEQAMESTQRSTQLSSPPAAAPEPAKSGGTLAASEPADPRTIPLIREQLELLQNRTFTWQGEGWPGQPLKWQVEERDANPDEAGPRTWQSTLHLNLPRLGEVHAALRLAGKSLTIAITGSSASTAQELQTAVGKLREQLEAHNISLNAIEVQHD